METKKKDKPVPVGKQEKGRKNYWLSGTGKVLSEEEAKALDKVLIKPKS